MHSPTGTARGDRNQRRIDVLRAATQILEESGWAGLSMREVAARAGVSAGATYQWFSGKDEIYAELYTARLAQGIDAFAALPDDIGLDDLLTGMFRWAATTWAELGRWQLEFAEAARAGEPSDAVRKLDETHELLLEAGLDRLTRAAAAEGRAPVADADLPQLVWAAASGLALRAAVLELDADALDRLQRTTVRAFVAGLFEAA